MAVTNEVAETEGQTGSSKRVTLSSDPDLFYQEEAASRISDQEGHTEGQRKRLQGAMLNAILAGELDAYDQRTGALLHLPFEMTKPVCVRVPDVNDWAKRTGKPWQWISLNSKTRVAGVAAEALVGTPSVNATDAKTRVTGVAADGALGTVTVTAPEKIQNPTLAARRLTTKELAHSFDGISDWPAGRWLKNLSSSKWLHPARIDLGAPGRASATWNPLIVAQMLHGRTKGDRARKIVLKSLNSKFRSNPLLEPWRDDWNEYFATEIANE